MPTNLHCETSTRQPLSLLLALLAYAALPPDVAQTQPPVQASANSPAAKTQPAESEVWLCHSNLDALVAEDAEWAYVREHLDGIKLYIDKVGGRRANRASDETLKRLVRLCEKDGIQLAVECGGTLEFAPLDSNNGERSAEIEFAKIKRLTEAGGNLAYLDVDGPIRRLLYPGTARQGLPSVDACATELVDALREHRKAYPDLRFWLLVNFPNWGWKDGVSYHARGPQRQDWGDYLPVLQTVLRRTREAGVPFDGVTVDFPYDYAVGKHRSVNLKPPTQVDWIARIRDLEGYVEKEGLEFNLIVNSEAGGQASDEAFYHDTLAYVDAYLAAGGSPKRWIVQSWYPHPKQVVPETAPHTMTALVRAVIKKLRSGPPAKREDESSEAHRLHNAVFADQFSRTASPPPLRQASFAREKNNSASSGRIVVEPDQGKMAVRARVPILDDAGFVLGIPETIGCREAMLVNFPEAKVQWDGPDDQGVVSCTWGPGGRISYTARLIPSEDYVDLEMTVRNHTEFLWHDVFAFNCLNPVDAPAFKDWKLKRTYMSSQGKPLLLADTERVKGTMPTVGFYLHERIGPKEEPVFVRGFQATSPDRTDGSWIVTLSEPAGSYMAATTLDSVFLFDNLDRCCIHSAPSFGDVGPQEASTTVSRFYLARGDLEDFLNRYGTDRVHLAKRQKWARPSSGKPYGRMEEMLPDELEAVLEKAPIAYVPLGTYEHHGWHLPVCFDGIKAHALCEKAAARTGGAVLPTFFYGTGGGHIGYKWTLILPEQTIAPLIESTLDHLAKQGFKVVVLLTGHYPKEQVDMVHRLASEAQTRHPDVKFIGLTEPEITTPQAPDRAAGDHAAKYETSIALALNPGWVRVDLLESHDPDVAALPETPRKETTPYDPTHPLYAIHGQDPRTTASRQLGQRLVEEIVSRLAKMADSALSGNSQQTKENQ